MLNGVKATERLLTYRPPGCPENIMGVWESIVLVQCHEMAVLPYHAIRQHPPLNLCLMECKQSFFNILLVTMFLQYELLAVMIHDAIL